MTTTTTIIELPTKALTPDPDNRSVKVDKQLRTSIASTGVQTPLRVREHPTIPDTYEIVAGERRWRAATDAGIETVPCILFTGSDGDRIVAQALENLMRQDFTPIEEAQVFLRAVDADVAIKDLAAQLGFSAAYVRRRIALLDLPPEALAKLDSGEWAISDADEVAKHVNNDDLMKWILKQQQCSWSPLARQITLRVADTERKNLIAKRTEELTAKGHQVCTANHFTIWDNQTALKDLGITVKDHRREPCHAIGLRIAHGTTDLTEVPCCTDKSRHAPATDSNSTVQSPVLAEREATRGPAPGPTPAQLKAQRQAHKADQARRQIVRDASTHGAAFIDLLVSYILATEESYNNRAQALCESLQIAPASDADIETSWSYWDDMFSAHIANSDAKTRRQAARAVIALDDTFASGNNTAASRLNHADVLKRLGWKPTNTDNETIAALETDLAHEAKADTDEEADADEETGAD